MQIKGAILRWADCMFDDDDFVLLNVLISE